MGKISALLMAGFLLGSVFFAPAAKATTTNTMPLVQFEKTLSEFLPVSEEKKSHGKSDEKNETAKGQETHKEKWADKRQHMKERIENLPPEERAETLKKMEEMKARREAVREELRKLPPEERETRMKELRDEFHEKRDERHEEFREKFKARWDSASEEERNEFCANARVRCASNDDHACEFAKKSCSPKE